MRIELANTDALWVGARRPGSLGVVLRVDLDSDWRKCRSWETIVAYRRLLANVVILHASTG